MPENNHNGREQGDASGLRRRRGIYLLPNLFTTAGLFAGFYAIVAGMNGRFEAAAVAIFVAMVMDGIDGRIARLTNTQSDFGAEYDSLADMVSFGIAPALVVYSWGLNTLGKFGWLAAFVYTACAALRLARFNTQTGMIDKRYFQGLASPAAAAIIAGMVWSAHDYGLEGKVVMIAALVLTVLVSALMVSKMRYYSFKDFNLKGKVPFLTLVVLVPIIVLISIDPPLVLFAVFLLYGLSGPVLTLLQLRNRRLTRKGLAAGESAEPKDLR
ncbi:MAG: CDP-diacylglycerol--serine O-phosphatidyltransferase [Gammaproteobacteria bacterium]|nr:CDP-diacylglycerol--serine O-phosphatidyltransferase [Gammaproteobacteria bacterium]